ncbi:type I pantothenate kinase, partial [Streptococcus suis]
YDIVPNQMQTISEPDFLIIEGINVFQNQQNNRLYISDYFDFSIYIDADSRQIEAWYLERFESLLELAKKDKTNYYHRFTSMSKDNVLAMA